MFEQRTVGATDNYGKQNAFDHLVCVRVKSKSILELGLRARASTVCGSKLGADSKKIRTKFEQNSTRLEERLAKIGRDWKRVLKIDFRTSEK